MRHCGTAALVFLMLALGSPARGQTRWPEERQVGPFLCHADFSLAAHEGLLDEMSRLQEDLVATLGARQTREPIHLFLFRAKTTYRGYLQQYFPRVPYRRALYMKARGPGMVFAYQGADFAIDVRHESTHALLHAWLPSVPLWLDEGLAEYFEVPRDKRAAENPHLAEIKELTRGPELPQLEALETIQNIDEMGRDEYRDAWAWMHFLLHGPPEGREELMRYLDELEAGGKPGQLSDRLRRRMPELNHRFAEHFR